MAITIRGNVRRREADAYLQLVRELPLKTIKNDDEHERAVVMIAKLLGRDLGFGAGDYLDTLILIVNKYEDEHHTPMTANLTPQRALRAIMKANNMTQADIGNIIGSESVVSMFLKGRRELSKTHIKALAARFRVDAGLFL